MGTERYEGTLESREYDVCPRKYEKEMFFNHECKSIAERRGGGC